MKSGPGTGICSQILTKESLIRLAIVYLSVKKSSFFCSTMSLARPFLEWKGEPKKFQKSLGLVEHSSALC